MAGSSISAEMAAEMVGEYVQLSFPNDEEKLFKLLTQVNDQIWETGKFHNSVSYFYCKVFEDGTIITPHGHNILLGIDINGKPIDIRDQYFLFHKNALGDVLKEREGLSNDVLDLGESPVMFQPTAVDGCCCPWDDKEPKMLSVKAPDCTYLNTDSYTLVSGLDAKGKNIYSYEKSSKGKTIVCVCEPTRVEEGIEVMDGVKYPISSQPIIYKNIVFSRIRNILKTPTLVPLEYYAVDKYGRGLLIARLEPNQITSRYRRYKIPHSCCKRKCVLGLFKVTQPDPVISRKQLMLTGNRNALISLAISVDKKYTKGNIQESIPYLADAIGHLNAELRENQSGAHAPIQVQTYASYRKVVPRM